MYMDAEIEFSDSQAVTASAISTNVYDRGAAPTLADIGTGEDLTLVVQVDTLPVSAGASTLIVTLESDSTADLATSATTHYTSASFLKAALAAGTEVARVHLPAGSYERYIGIRYTVGVADYTAGAFSAYVVKDAQADAILPDAL